MSIDIQLSYTLGMKEEKEKFIPRSYRLPAVQVDFIELLAKKRVFSTNRSAIVRTLLDHAIKEIIETEYIQKHEKTMRLLKRK